MIEVVVCGKSLSYNPVTTGVARLETATISGLNVDLPDAQRVDFDVPSAVYTEKSYMAHISHNCLFQLGTADLGLC